MFAKCPGDRNSIRGRVIPKTQKLFLMPPCITLSIKRYGPRVKWSNPGKGVAPFPTPRCSYYWKGSPRPRGPLSLFIAASHQTGLDTRSKAWRPIKVGIKGGGGREWAETRTLLVCAGRPTKCNVGLMRQAVSQIQIWIRARMPGYGLN